MMEDIFLKICFSWFDAMSAGYIYRSQGNEVGNWSFPDGSNYVQKVLEKLFLCSTTFPVNFHPYFCKGLIYKVPNYIYIYIYRGSRHAAHPTVNSCMATDV